MTIKEPQLISFEELGVSVSQAKISSVAHWIAANAAPCVITHHHASSRDGRSSSPIRRVVGLLHNQNIPSDVSGVVRDIYNATTQYASNYFSRPITGWDSPNTVVGHAYFPGDTESSEGHLDMFPSATSYFEVPSQGGRLYIARSKDASTLEEIYADCYTIDPQPGTVAIFDGQILPHYTDGLPVTAVGARISFNASYSDLSCPVDESVFLANNSNEVMPKDVP